MTTMLERVKAVLRDKTDWTIDGKLGESDGEEALTEAAQAAIEESAAVIAGLRAALEQIASTEVDIFFLADHIVWAKGVAREALKPTDGAAPDSSKGQAPQ